MNKIIKAQAGVAVRAIPTIAPALPAIGSVVSKVLPVIGGVPGVITSTLFDIATGGKSGRPGASQRNSGSRIAAADATRVARPVIVPTLRGIDLHLGKHRTATKAIPVSRVRIKVASAPVDTTKVGSRAATGSESSRDTTRTQPGSTSPENQTVDDRNILQRLGDRMAKRKRQNNSTPNSENKPPRNWRDKAKTGLKWGMYGFVANEADNKIFDGGVKKIVKGVLDLGFDKPDTVYVQQSAKNRSQQQQADSVQNDTTQTYNGFLINELNPVK